MAHSAPARRRIGAWVLVTILVLISVLGTLIVPIYTRSSPAWGAFPFFYWYQLIWVPVVAVLMAICYLLTTRGKPPDPDHPGPTPGGPAQSRGGSGEAL